MEIVDEGWVAVKVTDADGVAHGVQLDLYEVDCAVTEAIKAAYRDAGSQEPGGAVWANIVEAFKARGLPPMSYGAAHALVLQIRKAIDSFKKKHIGEGEPDSPDSPDSTESTPGD